jgi:hypothetical protein
METRTKLLQVREEALFLEPLDLVTTVIEVLSAQNLTLSQGITLNRCN